MNDTYIPGFSNALQHLAVGGTVTPQAAELQDAAQRAYENARLASFGASGELSPELAAIRRTRDFNYSPAALDYMQGVQDYLTSHDTGYNLTPMNVGTAVDLQTGAPLPLTSGQLEQFAQQPVADQFYANFNNSKPGGWDVGNLQFAPNQQYRLIDRATGDVVYSGTGYEAGKNISQLATGLFDKSGQQANWAIEQAAPGSTDWSTRYQHEPDVNGLMTYLKIVGPMIGGALAAPLGLGGSLGAAAGSAAGAAGAGVAAGDSLTDILKNAALSGATAYAGGELFKGLGANPSSTGGGVGGTPSGGVPYDGLTVFAPVANKAGALASGLASNVGKPSANQPTNAQNPIVVTANPAANVAPITGALGSVVNPATNPNEIVVEGRPNVTNDTTIPPLVPFTGDVPLGQTPELSTEVDSGLSTVDKLRLGLLGAGLLGGAAGGGGSGTIPGGLGGGQSPIFSAKLPAANLPVATPRTDMGNIDYYRYGYGPEQSFFSNVPQGAPNTSKAYTGYEEREGLAMGGQPRTDFAVGGPGDGREDKIPAMLSDGEYVIDAETVAMLGNGSNKAGAKALDSFRVNVRKHKGHKLAKGEFSRDAKRPEQYLKGRK